MSEESYIGLKLYIYDDPVLIWCNFLKKWWLIKLSLITEEGFNNYTELSTISFSFLSILTSKYLKVNMQRRY